VLLETRGVYAGAPGVVAEMPPGVEYGSVAGGSLFSQTHALRPDRCVRWRL